MTQYGAAVCDWDGRAESIADAVSKTKVERIYLCVEDRHVLHRQDNVHEAIEEFTSRGIEVVLDPWGVSNMFAGETTAASNWSYINWVKFAETTNASAILLDEPTDIKLLSYMIHQVRLFAPSKSVIAAIQPEKLTKDNSYTRYLDREKIDELTVSTYLFGNQVKKATYENLIDWYDRLSWVIPKDSGIWIQTWDLPEGTEWVPTAIMDIFDMYCKYDKINIWAWDAFRTVSSKRPANPDLVWNNILNKIQK